MWICTNNGFISVVAFRGRPDQLLVRGRLSGDIEAIFPEAKVVEGAGTDYRFRTTVSRDRFWAVLA
ncbi:hypothetical protein N8071_01155, partial [bacterium]|nr:hypothetical protein [bacterium]